MGRHQSQRKTTGSFSRDKNSHQLLSISSLKFIKFFLIQKMNIIRYFGLFLKFIRYSDFVKLSDLCYLGNPWSMQFKFQAHECPSIFETCEKALLVQWLSLLPLAPKFRVRIRSFANLFLVVWFFTNFPKIRKIRHFRKVYISHLRRCHRVPMVQGCRVLIATPLA